MKTVNWFAKYREITENLTSSSAKPTLLLHACCAPCSSAVLETLSDIFEITLFFHNPNISPIEEYTARYNELVRFVKESGLDNVVKTVNAAYNPNEFFKIAKGLEALPEGGERCFKCYRLRLEATAEAAKNGDFDYFCTTLSISPHKNADMLNKIGDELSAKYGVAYLYSDFKKKDGYKRSIELSKQYNLYRQNYCGCVYSAQQASKK